LTVYRIYSRVPPLKHYDGPGIRKENKETQTRREKWSNCKIKLSKASTPALKVTDPYFNMNTTVDHPLITVYY
jgi:hypothetical protein